MANCVAWCVVLFSLFSLVGLVLPDPVPADRYTVDLDLPPEERWVNITKKYAQYVPAIIAAFHKEFPKEIRPFAEKFALYLDQHFPEPFPGEMRSVSKGMNLTLADVVLLNIFYDLSAFCTGIVVQRAEDGGILHGRNLDYRHTDLLRNLSFIADFKSKGKTVYTGVLTAGAVGLITAQRPHAVTISLDERDRGFIWENIIHAFEKNVLPISFLIRYVVSKEGVDFNQAVQLLSSTPLMAAAYLIVGGVKQDEGAVITRARDSAVDVWRLDSNHTRWFLVETNYDHWTTPPPSDDRRDPAIKALKKLGQAKVDASSLFQVMAVDPVTNNLTIYTTIMAAGSPDLLNAWVQHP